MSVLTQTLSANTAITFDISSLATSSTFVAGRNSTEIDNTSTNYVDCIVDVEGITAHASTATTAGQYIGLWVYGGDTSFATKVIGGSGAIDGVDGACTLPHVGVLNGLKHVASAVVVTTTAGLVYYIQPFSVRQFFGDVMPKFWGLYLAHNHTGALAASQSTLFSFNGVTYTQA